MYHCRKWEEGEIDHVGEYLEINRPHLLFFTFGVPRYLEEMAVVTIDITSEGHGWELNQLHEDVLPEWAERTQEGWGKILQTLNTIL
ncbi:SRPBCC family protein [Candidatus Nitrospira salsa]